jgi:hypothetical protein
LHSINNVLLNKTLYTKYHFIDEQTKHRGVKNFAQVNWPWRDNPSLKPRSVWCKNPALYYFLSLIHLCLWVLCFPSSWVFKTLLLKYKKQPWAWSLKECSLWKSSSIHSKVLSRPHTLCWVILDIHANLYNSLHSWHADTGWIYIPLNLDNIKRLIAWALSNADKIYIAAFINHYLYLHLIKLKIMFSKNSLGSFFTVDWLWFLYTISLLYYQHC